MSSEIRIEETLAWKHLKCTSEVCNALLLGLGCVGLRVDELENFVKWRREDFGNVKGVIIMYNIDQRQRNLTKEIRSNPESIFFTSAVVDETSLLAGILNVVYNSGLSELDVGQKLIEHRMLPDPVDRPIFNGFALLNNKQLHKVNNTVAKLKFAAGSINTFNHSEVIIPFDNEVYGLDCSRGTISNLNGEVEPHNWFAKIANKLTCIVNVFHQHNVAFTILIVVADIKHVVKIKFEELHREIQMNGTAKVDKLLEMCKLEDAFTRNYSRGQFLFDNLVCYSDEQRILMNMLFEENTARHNPKVNSYTRRQLLKRTTRAYEILLRKRALKEQKSAETKNTVSQQLINERLGFPKGKPVKVMKSRQTMLAAKAQKAIQALEKKTKEINAAITKQKNGSQLNTSKHTNKSQEDDDDNGTESVKNVIKKERKNARNNNNEKNKRNKIVKREVDGIGMKENELNAVEKNEIRNVMKSEQVIITDNKAAKLNRKKIFLQHVSESSVILLQNVPKKETGALEKMIDESVSMATQGKYSAEEISSRNFEVNAVETDIKRKQQSNLFSLKEKKAILTNHDKASETFVAVNNLGETRIQTNIKNHEENEKKEMEAMKTNLKESKIQIAIENKKEKEVLNTNLNKRKTQIDVEKLQQRNKEKVEGVTTDIRESKIQFDMDKVDEKMEMEVIKADLKEELIQAYEEIIKTNEVRMMELKKGIKIEHSFEDEVMRNDMKMKSYFVLGTETEINSKDLEDENDRLKSVKNDMLYENNLEDKADEAILNDKLKSNNKFCEIAKVNTFISCGISDISTLAKEASMFALGIPLD